MSLYFASKLIFFLFESNNNIATRPAITIRSADERLPTCFESTLLELGSVTQQITSKFVKFSLGLWKAFILFIEPNKEG